MHAFRYSYANWTLDLAHVTNYICTLVNFYSVTNYTLTETFLTMDQITKDYAPLTHFGDFMRMHLWEVNLSPYTGYLVTYKICLFIIDGFGKYWKGVFYNVHNSMISCVVVHGICHNFGDYPKTFIAVLHLYHRLNGIGCRCYSLNALRLLLLKPIT